MSENAKVRYSRDGDHFHYLWAARRCLRLLAPTSGLVAVTIEDAAADEGSKGVLITAGDELIDVAEYYGSTEFTKASQV